MEWVLVFLLLAGYAYAKYMQARNRHLTPRYRLGMLRWSKDFKPEDRDD